MSKTFETQHDVDRESKAIQLLFSDCEILKQEPHSVVDYLIVKDGKKYAVEVKGVKKVDSVHDEHQAVVGLRKLVDLQSWTRKVGIPMSRTIIVWAYSDGVKYTNITNLKGYVYYGGRKPRDGSTNDMELMFRSSYRTNFKTKKYV